MYICKYNICVIDRTQAAPWSVCVYVYIYVYVYVCVIDRRHCGVDSAYATHSERHPCFFFFFFFFFIPGVCMSVLIDLFTHTHISHSHTHTYMFSTFQPGERRIQHDPP
jgi:hypothetical protein